MVCIFFCKSCHTSVKTSKKLKTQIRKHLWQRLAQIVSHAKPWQSSTLHIQPLMLLSLFIVSFHSISQSLTTKYSALLEYAQNSTLGKFFHVLSTESTWVSLSLSCCTHPPIHRLSCTLSQIMNLKKKKEPLSSYQLNLIFMQHYIFLQHPNLILARRSKCISLIDNHASVV